MHAETFCDMHDHCKLDVLFTDCFFVVVEELKLRPRPLDCSVRDGNVFGAVLAVRWKSRLIMNTVPHMALNDHEPL